MKITVDDLLGVRAHDPRGLNRMISWSLAVHVGAVALLLLAPKLGWITPKPPVKIITINLGGVVDAKPGPTTLGGRPVDQAVPEPKRPEIIQPAIAKPDVMTIPTKATPPPKKATPPQKQEQPKLQVPTKQPPTTGRQAAPGNTRAETGVSGIGTGLAVGRGAGNLTSPDDFCCKAYLDDVQTRILRKWDPRQPERGTISMRFTIQRNGQVTDVAVDKGGSFLLEMASKAPFQGLQLPPLPPEYTPSTLPIRFTFEYK
jgi:outer membrane biosynthesis protein TonB